MQDIHVAAYNGDGESLSRLLAAGALVNGRDRSGYTPLLWACFRAGVADYVPVIRMLAGAGADIEATTGQGAESCLILAVQSGSAPAVHALIELGAQVNAAVDGVTPLMVAAGKGDRTMVCLLLNAGANPNIACGSRKASDYADYYGHNELAAELTLGACRSRDS